MDFGTEALRVQEVLYAKLHPVVGMKHLAVVRAQVSVAVSLALAVTSSLRLQGRAYLKREMFSQAVGHMLKARTILSLVCVPRDGASGWPRSSRCAVPTGSAKQHRWCSK